MNTLLAALDTSPGAAAVLDTALRLGKLTGDTVEAVHVRDGPTESLEWLAAQAEVDLRLLEGPVETTLLAAVEEPGVDIAVFGARATTGGRRIGSNALHVLKSTDKPVAVVPPDVQHIDQPFRRLLVPLEGSEHSSSPIVDTLCPLVVADVELVVLHVFTAATVPPVLDRPNRDLAMWGSEFLARHCPNASRIELRSGSIAARVNDVCQAEHADLIVLSWSQDSSLGRAAVVRDVLAHSTVPVLLIPAGHRRSPHMTSSPSRSGDAWTTS
jgi:nucleotide-binding universal stress UspA family protein